MTCFKDLPSLEGYKIERSGTVYQLALTLPPHMALLTEEEDIWIALGFTGVYRTFARDNETTLYGLSNNDMPTSTIFPAETHVRPDDKLIDLLKEHKMNDFYARKKTAEKEDRPFTEDAATLFKYLEDRAKIEKITFFLRININSNMSLWEEYDFNVFCVEELAKTLEEGISKCLSQLNLKSDLIQVRASEDTSAIVLQLTEPRRMNDFVLQVQMSEELKALFRRIKPLEFNIATYPNTEILKGDFGGQTGTDYQLAPISVISLSHPVEATASSFIQGKHRCNLFCYVSAGGRIVSNKILLQPSGMSVRLQLIDGTLKPLDLSSRLHLYIVFNLS